jgi:hypothetical protein
MKYLTKYIASRVLVIKLILQNIKTELICEVCQKTNQSSSEGTKNVEEK